MSMTPAQIKVLAHALRWQLQAQSCCPRHAGDILLGVLAGFALDAADDDLATAARALTRADRRLAWRLRRGDLVMARSTQ